MIPVLHLVKGKEKFLQNLHPWVFSGALKEQDPKIENGALVKLCNFKDEFLALGFYNKGSIAIRIISKKDVALNGDFWKALIHRALETRVALGLLSNLKETNCFRLFHGEGDGIPGLIIDVYNDNVVFQCHHHGLLPYRKRIVEALEALPGLKVNTIYEKSQETIPGEEGENKFWLGSNSGAQVIEHGHLFDVNWTEGQKTGFFIDQRENRALLKQLSKGKKVLNTFCYSGGFSIYALSGGATEVHSVDSSAKAIQLLEQNLNLNKSKSIHKSFTEDTFDFFKNNDEKYDIILLDPPAFAKKHSALQKAGHAYQRLNKIGIERLNPGGILFTFSCSQAMEKGLFRKIVFSAAAETQREVKILHQLSQPSDHPINIYHPEGEYLKGLVIQVF